MLRGGVHLIEAEILKFGVGPLIGHGVQVLDEGVVHKTGVSQVDGDFGDVGREVVAQFL